MRFLSKASFPHVHSESCQSKIMQTICKFLTNNVSFAVLKLYCDKCYLSIVYCVLVACLCGLSIIFIEKL